jgi:hypothetical protein
MLSKIILNNIKYNPTYNSNVKLALLNKRKSINHPSQKCQSYIRKIIAIKNFKKYLMLKKKIINYLIYGPLKHRILHPSLIIPIVSIEMNMGRGALGESIIILKNHINC